MDTEGIRLLEEALRKSEADSRLLVDLLESSDQPFAVGYPDGHIGTVNAAFERLTGFNRNELRAMSWAEALTPAEWRGMERAKVEELQGKGLSATAASGANGGAEGLGVGISGMRERMRQLGGRLEVRSGEVGVTVRAVIPGDPIGILRSPLRCRDYI